MSCVFTVVRYVTIIVWIPLGLPLSIYFFHCWVKVLGNMLGNMLLATLLTENQMVYRNIEKGKMSPDMLEIAMKLVLQIQTRNFPEPSSHNVCEIPTVIWIKCSCVTLITNQSTYF